MDYDAISHDIFLWEISGNVLKLMKNCYGMLNKKTRIYSIYIYV